MRSSTNFNLRSLSGKVLAGVLGCILASRGGANPTGMQVVAGQASTVTSGNQLLITNSPGTILNWQQFSIMPGELTRFIQQSSSSSVLNRITGQNPSQILGTLQSNGRVFLLNPNGIVFGAGARVDVNGLVASSLGLSNGDFLAGKLRLSGAAGAGDVSNYGAITTPTGGQVYLIAPNVRNSGIITSPGGDVMLAAGHSVDLADSDDPDVRIVISSPGNEALNVGKVLADSGRVGVYGALVNQLGLVSANTAVVGEKGKIIFKATDTTILGAGSVTTAKGTVGSGGEVQVLGNRAGLTGDAVVDVSGQSGGGTILIGGDTHGGNPAVENAALTYLGPQSRVVADAVESGRGGKVVVWSDQQTQMYGTVSSRGGESAGDGGFVETSSAGKLDFRGQVDLRAPAGAAGTLLLDPSDVLITSGASSGDVTLPSGVPFTISGSNASSVLSVTDLQNELGLGNVTVTSSSGASAPLGGTITVAAPVTWSNSNSLTLAADQSIFINAPISASAGILILNAANGNIAQDVGGSLPAAISVASLSANAPNGSVILTEPTNSISGSVAGVGLNGFTLASSGPVTIGTVGSSVGMTSTNGSVALVAGGDISQVSGPITAAALSAVSTSGSVELTDPTNAVGVVAGSANGMTGFNFDNSGSFSVGTVSGEGVPTVNGITSTGAQVYSVDLATPSTGDITLDATVDGGASNVLMNAAGAVNQGSDGVVSAAGVYIYANGAGGIGSSSAPLLLNVGAVRNVTAQAGPIYLSNAGDLTLYYVSANGVVGISSAGSISTGTMLGCDCTVSTAGAAVNLTANGSLDVGAGYPVTGTSGVSLYAGYNASTGTYVGSNNTLGVEGTVTAPAVALSAGGAISVAGTITGNLTETPNQFSPPPPPPPSQPVLTLSECIANPSLAGCSAVLPSLSQCIAAPSTPGCSVVLPTIVACTTAPSTAGCQVVLPTLASCIANPTQSGCQAVLPTLASCVANPSQSGCQAVLPTLASCVANPSRSGCQAVLPTLAQCVANPSLSGCSAVLPSDDQCKVSPTLAGCKPPATTGNSDSPVVQEVNHVVNLVNDSVNQVTSDAASSGTTANQTSVEDKKKNEGDPTGGSSKDSGAKANEHAEKMYCN
jgi:filamentous hemagglutinin family protein